MTTKRCIGIDIGPSHLRAVQICETDGQVDIEKVFTAHLRRRLDEPTEMLKKLFREHGFDRRADIALSMPCENVFFRNIDDQPATATEQDRKQQKAAMGNGFPIPQDELITQACSRHHVSDDKYSVLVAATTKSALHERLELFKGTRLRPKLVDAAILAVYPTIAFNHPQIGAAAETIAYIGETHLSLAIVQANNILTARNIPIPSADSDDPEEQKALCADLLCREASITWNKVFGDQAQPAQRIYLAATAEIPDDFATLIQEKLNCQLIAVDPYATFKSASSQSHDVAIHVAEGLALRLLAPDKAASAGFHQPHNDTPIDKLDKKKDFTTCGILAAMIVIVFVGGFFLRLARLEAKHTGLKNEIKNVFQRTLPDEKNIVDPLAQIRQELQSLQNSYATFSSVALGKLDPFEALYSITTSVPTDADISIHSVLITTESARLTGFGKSFQSVYDWQELLDRTPGFSNIDMQNIEREAASQQVRFTMLMSLTMVEDK
ncbi:MAG: pilus assembly protein PilM [Planctomycetes bacterium]|nr:pilus assembly protein PilM [Planctomycetota bacterium]